MRSCSEEKIIERAEERQRVDEREKRRGKKEEGKEKRGGREKSNKKILNLNLRAPSMMLISSNCKASPTWLLFLPCTLQCSEI